jgi:hypothetical protein
VEDILSYCSDAQISKELGRVITDLNKSGVKYQSHEGGRDRWVECTYHGHDVAYFQPRRKYFNFQFYDSKKEDYVWPPKKLTSYEQWVKQCKKHVMKRLADAQSSLRPQRGGRSS